MRILIVSNLYPPHYLGGYEVHCAKVAERLVERGHQVVVLTSDYGVSGTTQPEAEVRSGVSVQRMLRQYAYGPQPSARPWTLHRAADETRDASTLSGIIDEVKPDVVSWWNLNGSSKLLPAVAAAAGVPSVYSIEDRWLIHEYGPEGEVASRFWRRFRTGEWVVPIARPLARLIAAPLIARLRRMGVDPTALGSAKGHAFFLSSYLEKLHRQNGVTFDSWEVVRGGVKVEDFFAPCNPERYSREELRILYVGQLTEDRAVHTVIEALGELEAATRNHVSLTVAGGGPSDYAARVRAQAHSVLGDRATFLGKVPHDSIPDVYREHQLMVFTSTRPEGLGFTMVEAMLAGCAVVTSGSGGAREVAELGDLPLFAPGDADELGDIIRALDEDRGRLAALAMRGQRVAQRELALDVMLDRFIEGMEKVRRDAET